MEIGNIIIQGYRRCSVEDLKRMLKSLDITLIGSFSGLTAHMGGDSTVYIKPNDGCVEKVEFKGNLRNINTGREYTFDDENGQRYKIVHMSDIERQVNGRIKITSR
jgi:hypothetical protein